MAIQKAKTILIADDDAQIRQLLNEILKNHGYAVIEAKDGKETLELFFNHEKELDLVLLDVMMPIVDGWTVCKKIKEHNTIIPVVMLTARGEEFDERYAFEIGTDDFIAKPIRPSALIARLEKRLEPTEKSKQAEELSLNGIKIELQTHRVTIDQQSIQLSPTEYNLLVYLIQHTSIVLSRETLLNDVWGNDYVGTLRTVDVHMARLRVKLGSKGTMLQAERGFGYKFEMENS